ncbi:glucosamine-6-phosphate deaminase [Paenarthrobacter sp. DKR-5]|uniref:glucosamine-6-phosphate deaminase n=1 Tax=Paenarthrobacter sp. DKR-5 TaxID=2835535 RepID=UPI001BDBF88F|nr:glucosamine-6-phosphate deaminase [Paenarthrobacter sp. DKR-5]MBT1004176.1 glucosamine-6-phosphate deaminase [Paenarthrobacter sp. DKR-5]
MDIILVENAEQLGAQAAALITARVQDKPNLVLGVATGSSPMPVYARLAAERSADFSSVSCFALDEYVGLAPADPNSYAAFVRRLVTEPLGIGSANTHLPDGAAPDVAAACAGYEARIKDAGGIDLQILGIGRNGHLAFNEPSSPLDSRTRVVELTEDTRTANARFFRAPEDVPRQAITQGLGTIREARELLLVASGRAKAAALRQALSGPVDASCPASLVQLHPRVTVIADQAAASHLDAGGFGRSNGGALRRTLRTLAEYRQAAGLMSFASRIVYA